VPDNLLRGDPRALEYKETLRQYAEREPEIAAYSDYLQTRGVWGLIAK
jgi:hypothetical protein